MSASDYTINNLWADALSSVISHCKSDIIALTQEIAAWVIVFCMKILKAGNLVIDQLLKF